MIPEIQLFDPANFLERNQLRLDAKGRYRKKLNPRRRSESKLKNGESSLAPIHQILPAKAEKTPLIRRGTDAKSIVSRSRELDFLVALRSYLKTSKWPRLNSTTATELEQPNG